MADEITFQNVKKTYDPGLFKKKVLALKGLSLDVQTNEIFGLIGPNGAGKSTTIKLLLNLIRPDEGEILFRGKVAEKNILQKYVGYLPENPYLYDHLTLSEILHFGGRSSGLSSGVIKERINLLVEKVSLGSVLKRPLRTFSKGMLQRAALCFSLLHDPRIVILDEPMSGLDPIGRKMVFDIVRDLKDEGKTVFFCSHILSDVERLCDRIGLLNQGNLIKSYHKRDFGEEIGVSVHLIVKTPHEDQIIELKKIGIEVMKENEKSIVSAPGARVAEVAATLSRLGVAIEGSRSERVSLENLFISAIQGAA